MGIFERSDISDEFFFFYFLTKNEIESDELIRTGCRSGRIEDERKIYQKNISNNGENIQIEQ